MRKLIVALLGVFVLTTSYVTKNKNVEVSMPVNFSKAFSSRDSVTVKAESSEINSTQALYNTIDFSSGTILKFDVFEKAVLGFNNLKKSRKN